MRVMLRIQDGLFHVIAENYPFLCSNFSAIPSDRRPGEGRGPATFRVPNTNQKPKSLDPGLRRGDGSDIAWSSFFNSECWVRMGCERSEWQKDDVATRHIQVMSGDALKHKQPHPSPPLLRRGGSKSVWPFLLGICPCGYRPHHA
jgi:hypothetical protein